MIRPAAALAAALLILLPIRPAAAPSTPHTLWFAPGPGTLDYIRLFDHPEEWAHARQLVSVFKFYQGHAQPGNQVFAPNTYEALKAAGAFQQLGRWGIKTALEDGAVKEFYCTPDASGMNDAVSQTVASIRAVEAAGGTVSYLAMDDPFASGKSAVCGGPSPVPTADRIATYFGGVRAAYPNVQIGWIEAYPLSSEPLLENMLDLLKARGATPAFLHADVDSRALRQFNADFTRDMRALRDACVARGVPFGIIVWGYNGDADALYALDAEHVVSEITAAFKGWDDMPEHIIVQSWAQTATGLSITPTNLPEDLPHTHTDLVWEIYRRLHGQTGPSTGVAIRR
jgi:hypothetical protein